MRAITDAVRLAGVNRRRRARLDDRRAELAARVDRERTLLDERRQELRADAIVPVLDGFARLRSGGPATPAQPVVPVRRGPAVLPPSGPYPASRPWRGRAALREQQEIGAALDRSEAALVWTEGRWADGLAHGAQVRAVLAELRAAIIERLPALADGGPVANWSDDRRADVAVLVDLVTAATALSGVAPADPTGAVTGPSREALAEARSHLDALPKGVLTGV